MFTPLYFSEWTFLFIHVNRLWLLFLISAYLRKHCYNNIFLISQTRLCSSSLFFRVLFPLTPSSVDLSTLWLRIMFVMYTFYSLKLYLLYKFIFYITFYICPLVFTFQSFSSLRTYFCAFLTARFTVLNSK